MNHSEQDCFQGQNEAKRLIRCTVNGLKSIQHNRRRAAIIGWLLLSAIQFGGTDLGSVFHSGLLRLLYPFAVVFILWAIVAHWGMYFTGKITSDRLMRAGLVDEAGIAPASAMQYRDNENKKATVTEFDSTVPLLLWKDLLPYIETALNVRVVKMVQGCDLRRVLPYTIPASEGLPSKAPWLDEYLSKDNFVITFGMGLLGPVTINLSKICHWLIGGSTGSGKSVLLKLILMQCIRKGACHSGRF